jgi:type II secretory pathway component PulC
MRRNNIMMTREEILNSSRELVDQIYSKMSVIESCDTVVEKIKDLDVCFNDQDNKQIVVLNEILNTEQLTGIREGIISRIHDNAKSAQDYLERLSRKPAIINPEFE